MHDHLKKGCGGLAAFFVMWEMVVVALKIKRWKESPRVAAAGQVGGEAEASISSGSSSVKDGHTGSNPAAATTALAEAAAFTPKDAPTFEYADLVAATTSFAASRIEGTGAFGAVYRGMLPSLGLTVAVKVFETFETDGVSKRKSVAAFEAEVSALSASQHPHFVQLLGVSRDGQ